MLCGLTPPQKVSFLLCSTPTDLVLSNSMVCGLSPPRKCLFCCAADQQIYFSCFVISAPPPDSVFLAMQQTNRSSFHALSSQPPLQQLSLMLKITNQPTEKHGIQKRSNWDFDKAVQLQKAVKSAGRIVRNTPDWVWTTCGCLPWMHTKAKGSTPCLDQSSKATVEAPCNAVKEGSFKQTTLVL